MEGRVCCPRMANGYWPLSIHTWVTILLLWIVLSPTTYNVTPKGKLCPKLQAYPVMSNLQAIYPTSHSRSTPPSHQFSGTLVFHTLQLPLHILISQHRRMSSSTMSQNLLWSQSPKQPHTKMRPRCKSNRTYHDMR